MHTTLSIDTRGPGLYELTDRLRGWLANGEAAGGEGLLTLFIRHTSASLLIQENAAPEVQDDLLDFLDRLAAPADDPAMAYLRHRQEGPDDMPAHIKAALLPVSLQIPVIQGRMTLGTWQGVYLVEHRARPHRREVVAMLR
jgi:secondary thiamine-phosphate synthase enzyme